MNPSPPLELCLQLHFQSAPSLHAEKSCPSLPRLYHGHQQEVAGAEPLTVEFFCNHSYALSGDARRVCQPDGTWSGKQPLCVRGIERFLLIVRPSSHVSHCCNTARSYTAKMRDLVSFFSDWRWLRSQKSLQKREAFSSYENKSKGWKSPQKPQKITEDNQRPKVTASQ